MPIETQVKTIEAAFKEYTTRDDIAIVLISQNAASLIRSAIDQHTKVGLACGTDCCAPERASACACCLPSSLFPAHHLLACSQAVPSVLEIPSKDHPYEQNQDGLLRRVKHIMGAV